MNPWEGISDQDRTTLERLAASFACSVDALRLAWRAGHMAGFSKAVGIMVDTERRVNPRSFGERVA